ncbi:MAG: phosphate signaling complex protein PhoU [Spartobacteria bacterium]|nr:phosphate signaling complex protein PhoU [Spartobacteria bacterium]
MSKHLQTEVEKLKKKTLALSAVVEDQVERAVSSVHLRNEGIAQQVIDKDEKIDQAEVDVEEECLKILALHQPVAIDLRFIVAVLKLNNDLERIGDLAVNIAERALYLSRVTLPDIPFDFDGMARVTREMLKKALDALVNLDEKLAWEVCAQDDEVDAINREMYTQVKQAIRSHPEHLEALIHLLSVSRHLERIADHATNIAEDVIYMIEGKIVRHQAEVFN